MRWLLGAHVVDGPAQRQKLRGHMMVLGRSLRKSSADRRDAEVRRAAATIRGINSRVEAHVLLSIELLLRLPFQNLDKLLNTNLRKRPDKCL